MDAFNIQTLTTLADDPMMVVAFFIFLTVAMVTVAVFRFVASRSEISRRAAKIGTLGAETAGGAGHGRPQRVPDATSKLINYVTNNIAGVDQKNTAKLRRQLVQAGFLSRTAVGWFFTARLGGALLVGALAGVVLPMLFPDAKANMAAAVIGGGGLVGYLLPSIYLGRRLTRLQDQHRAGFPDFMDLMVVCADAGLAMESAIDRVGRELAPSYPSLAGNLYMAILEIRAGKTLGEALDHLGDRLNIDEARSFATLLQQSEELGSSLNEALRVYSDDMRHRRLSRAEEKAYALPAKLVIPLTLCIFPVLLVVTLLPVVVRFKTSGY